MAAVLKTVERQRSGGSNPSASASKRLLRRRFSRRLRDFILLPPRRSASVPQGTFRFRFAPSGASRSSHRSSLPARRLMPPSALRASKASPQWMSEGAARRNPGGRGITFDRQWSRNYSEPPFSRVQPAADACLGQGNEHTFQAAAPLTSI